MVGRPFLTLRALAQRDRDEINGACAFGMRPEFPLPRTLQRPPCRVFCPNLPHILVRTMSVWDSLSPARTVMADLLQDLYLLTAEIEQNAPAIWSDPQFLGFKLNPLLHQIVSADLVDECPTLYDLIERCWRLAAMVYIGDLRKRFMRYRVTGHFYVVSLRKAIGKATMHWGEFESLKSWILFIAAYFQTESGQQTSATTEYGACSGDLASISSFSLYFPNNLSAPTRPRDYVVS